MRSFFNLTLDPGPHGLEHVCDYSMGSIDSELEEFDSAVFRRCQWFEGPFPSYVKLWVEPGMPSDALGEPLSWPLWSEKLMALVRPFAKGDIQEIAAPIFYVDKKEPVTRYRLVNILRSLEAIDMARSVTSEMNILGTKITNVIRAVYREAAIPRDVHIFRSKEAMSRIVISEELARAIVDAKVFGVSLIATDTI
jgi:hypothetical protein